MKILISGASGLLGTALSKDFSEAGYKVYSGFLTHKPKFGTPIRINITDEREVYNIAKRLKPNVIINSAALTNVDTCETKKDLAWKINVDGTKNLLKYAEKTGAKFILISTDYVFDGEKGLYTEEDMPNPINFYGYTKLKAEEIVMRNYDNYLIVRTSVIYGPIPSSGKKNFALWIFENLKLGKKIKIIVDQWNSPTLNINLSKMILEAVEKDLSGIYHFAGNDRVSRYEFALEFASVFGLDKNLIEEIRMDEINWRARRPKDSSLNVSKAKKILDNKPLRLREALKILRETLSGMA